jgi:tryptophan synthase alpha chain
MIRAGAGLIEIGIPFSDPIAEGPVIQRANIRALAASTTVDKIFALVSRLREKTSVPIVFLSYLNPVFKYTGGYDGFFSRCARSGVDGIIIPDLPFEEHAEVRTPAAKHGVDIISLIAPTSAARVKDIAQAAQGFLYIVSSMGITGMRGSIETDLGAIISKVRADSALPACVGFGINTPEQAAAISKIADGVIVGSAIVKIIETHAEKAAPFIYDYVSKMTAAMVQ